jgi:D-3-phosphoglycerate dehydrogenase
MSLGIIGFGKIGSRVAGKAKALGMKVTAYDPYVPAGRIEAAGVKAVNNIEEIVQNADVITSHMSQTPENQGLFNAGFFAKARRKPFFLNMARGGSVVEADLAEALDKGLLRGAALDVLDREDPVLESHPLVGRENVIITPHAAFYTSASAAALERICAGNIVHFMRGEKGQVFKLVN